ncbi:hypothetical protein [Salimicrobium humidisoli]|uniref:hypothetical protein n=1 Tax=Salimicrobium humidisoli TaxID=2029857 RepID=UPI001304698B|nr:hypothetical protein [Salimicrobium humidisoli]
MKVEKREWRNMQTQEEYEQLEQAVKADGGRILDVRALRNGTLSVTFATYHGEDSE